MDTADWKAAKWTSLGRKSGDGPFHAQFLSPDGGIDASSNFAKPVRTVHGDTRNVHCNLLYFQCLLDGLSRQLRIVATEFSCTIDNHLRGVNAVQIEAPRVIALAITEEA